VSARALVFCALIAGAAAPAAARDLAGVGVAPDAARRALAAHVLATTGGERQPVAALRGEVLIVNFWASWCRPCRRELPALDALHASLAGRGARVLAVSIDEDPRNVDRFVRANRLTLPVYHDGPNGIARALSLTHVPCTLVLDARGEIVWATSDSDQAALDRLAGQVESLIERRQALSLPERGADE
jgi:thiol-disulfide isomerase/thioredoxin